MSASAARCDLLASQSFIRHLYASLELLKTKNSHAAGKWTGLAGAVGCHSDKEAE